MQFALGRGHAPAVRFAHPVMAAQTGGQFPLQLTPGDDVNIAVDGFVGRVHQREIRVVTFETTGDFLGRPAPMQTLVNFGPQRRVRGDRADAPPRRPTATLCRPLRLGGAVAARSAVQRHLPTDRSSRTPQPGGDDRLRLPGAQRRFQLDAFFQVQMRFAHHSPLPASRGGGKPRDGRRTSKPVLRPSLGFGGRLTGVNTTRKNSVCVHRTFVLDEIFELILERAGTKYYDHQSTFI